MVWAVEGGPEGRGTRGGDGGGSRRRVGGGSVREGHGAPGTVGRGRGEEVGPVGSHDGRGVGEEFFRTADYWILDRDSRSCREGRKEEM